jgi:methionyl-tRNA synthetase
MTDLSYSDFSKFDIRVGEILSAVELPKTRNLVEFVVDIGKEKPITIIETFGGKINLEHLIHKKILILTNLPPRKLMGFESEGIILAAEVNRAIYLTRLIPERELDTIPNGTKIK